LPQDSEYYITGR